MLLIIQNIQVNIGGGGDSNCRIRTETLDRNDGLFIVRYKVGNIELIELILHYTDGFDLFDCIPNIL